MTPQSVRAHVPPTPGLDITVVHEEEAFVVIHKPAGMLSVPGRGEEKQDCARARVTAMFPRATGSVSCHRLDMDTSGLLVMALDPGTHRVLSGQFEERRVQKGYEALVGGHLADPRIGERRVIELPHCVDWVNRPRQRIDWVQGKPSRTEAVVLRHERWTTPAGVEIAATRVELRPITGRTHQLRVHCAAGATVEGPSGPRAGGLGSAILGDRLYGDPGTAGRLLLHARRLGFWHPVTGAWVEFEAGRAF